MLGEYLFTLKKLSEEHFFFLLLWHPVYCKLCLWIREYLRRGDNIFPQGEMYTRRYTSIIPPHTNQYNSLSKLNK